MATETANYGLIKPEQTDLYNVDDFNSNMDSIDGAFAEIETDLENIQGKIGTNTNESDTVFSILEDIAYGGADTTYNVDDVMEAVQGVSNDVADVVIDVDGVLTAVGTLQTTATGIDTDTNSLLTKADSLATAVANVQTTATGIGTDTDSLLTKATALATAVSGVQTTANTINSTTSTINATANRIEADTESLITKVNTLQTTANGIDTDTDSLLVKATSLESSVASVSTKVDELGVYPKFYMTSSITSINLNIEGKGILLGMSGTTSTSLVANALTLTLDGVAMKNIVAASGLYRSSYNFTGGGLYFAEATSGYNFNAAPSMPFRESLKIVASFSGTMYVWYALYE